MRKLICCPICSSKKFKVILSATVKNDDPSTLYGAASGVRGSQQLVKCSMCTHIYENPMLEECEILNGYLASKEGDYDSQHNMRVLSFYNALRRNKALLPKASSNVLDVGTGGGAFLEAASRFGYIAKGLEPSAYLTECSKARGLDVVCGTLTQTNLEPNSFDLLTMWDVIEHIYDPLTAIKNAKKLLVKDGTILLNIPDIGTSMARIVGNFNWWFLSVHLHHFKSSTISMLAESVGMQVVSRRRYWQTLQFGYLQSIAEKLGVPFATEVMKATPELIKNLQVSYYASQYTYILKSK